MYSAVAIRVLWAVAFFGAASCAFADEKNESEAKLIKDGKLIHPLVLRDSQGGFAGFSGWIWEIETDGKWRRQPFLNKNVREADKKGTLSKKELAALAKELEEIGLLKLPAKIDGKPMVNPHVFSISFGKRQFLLVLGTGKNLPKAAAQGDAAGKFAAAVQVIQNYLSEKKPRKNESSEENGR